ncbi:MAG: hypothetical protein ACD_16C00038G0008 [uncultured bacterium]|nr:MAG: hypothetical protein ACD_16C00038G0008 [uncultured bacterium]OFW69123.1 MAG: hypothetical protein A2X70_07360 [Alphaproteobacteria bacterium GWC2_42_16]OFW73975.1 MAG: hypothetical protein A2Z80_04430 [Alphaproteobacteria bacterium GWA2_41_27]OFW82545.1 MAG: hypothetical protein A3E50_02970 [Alphaproteobacteria bacterium RIFCSPHIGHO2_12_FULL_42_100]OFW85825.1 MAG: hypothetical protein A2W06_02715 [Alphaproteobacteria bacterium RBG_16_42_14]OFW90636.1 MAG: hypothetical protein A2W46_077
MIHSFKLPLLTALSLSVTALTLSNANAVTKEEIDAAKVACKQAKTAYRDAKGELNEEVLKSIFVTKKAEFKGAKAKFNKQELEGLKDEKSIDAYLSARLTPLLTKFAKLDDTERGAKKPKKEKRYRDEVQEVTNLITDGTSDAKKAYVAKRLGQVNARIAKTDKLAGK